MPDDATEPADEDLVERARTGDDLALDTLLRRYRHYARAKARTYFLAGADKEDIVQEGMIGLYKAIRDFDLSQRSAFRAFAELCITRQIISAVKSSTRQKHIPLNSYVSLSKPTSADEDRPLGDVLVSATVVDPAEVIISAEEVAGLRASIHELLSSMEREVLSLYMEGRSYQEIANFLGRHVKSIDNALQRIKRKLQDHIAAASS